MPENEENEDYDGLSPRDVARYPLTSITLVSALRAEIATLKRERDMLQSDLVEGLELLNRVKSAGVLDENQLLFEETTETVALLLDLDAYLDSHAGYEQPV